jgi:hypothetical protein
MMNRIFEHRSTVPLLNKFTTILAVSKKNSKIGIGYCDPNGEA